MKRARKGEKKRDINLFSFFLLVDMGGFIGGGPINAPSFMTKGYFS
jgi:hypothetical protein